MSPRILFGLWLVCALCWPLATHAQSDRPGARAVWAESPITIDGVLDEAAWDNAPEAGNLVERTPKLREAPPVGTTFRVLYDADALYFGVRSADVDRDSIVGRIKTRDSSAQFSDDNVSIKLDPTLDRRTTLGFVLNPVGGMLDYRGINESEFRTEYDAVWAGASSMDDTGWSAEFRIPWTELGVDPMNPPERMGLNITRDHARRNATYDWALIPPPFSPIAASRYGFLTGFEELPVRIAQSGGASSAGGGPQVNWAIIPYALGGFRREGDPVDWKPEYNGGVDATLSVSTGWQAHLTVNTDFAQVEVDDQVVNLDRFSLFLPEKRDFFLASLEIFSVGVPEDSQLLYTRQIGLVEGQQIPVLAGLKVVGNVGNRLRVGLLEVITQPKSRPGDIPDIPWSSSLVGRAIYELGDGSNVGVMLTHQQSLDEGDDRNTVVGVDGAWRPIDNPMLIEAFALASFTGDADDADRPEPGGRVRIGYRGAIFRPTLTYSWYAPDLDVQLGFFRRVDIQRGDAALAIEPRIGRWGIERITFRTSAGFLMPARSTEFVDWNTRAAFNVDWDDGWQLGLDSNWGVETVSNTFRAAGIATIDPGTYQARRVVLSFDTPNTDAVAFTSEASIGDYFGGYTTGASLGVNARPNDTLRIDVRGTYGFFDLPPFQLDEDNPELPQGEKRAFNSAIINGRIALGILTNLGLDIYGGYNLIDESINLQSRLRWSYLPRSDLFVAWQLNVETDPWRERFQSLVVKMTYAFPQ